MKKLVTLLSVLFSLSAFGGQGGPDAYGYIWIDSNEPNGPAYSWFDNVNNGLGDPIMGLADDNVVGPFSFDSPFPFYWYSVNQFYIGSNGYVIFNNTNIASPFPSTIPSTASGQGADFVAGLMSDLNFTGANNPGSVWVTKTGDSTIITFDQVPFWNVSPPSYTGSNTFQIVFNAGDSSITINYQAQSGITNNNDIAIGIENATSTVGLEHSIDTYPSGSYTVKFFHPQSTTYQVSDVGVLWTGNQESKGIFVVANSVNAYGLKTNISNSGNQNIGSFQVGADIKNASGFSVLTDVKSMSGLNVGEDSTITFNQGFLPGAAGVYTYTTNTNLSGDATPNNNSKAQEIQAVNVIASNVQLSYADGVSNGSIGWSGGNGGIGVYYAPPVYPALIKSTEFYITSNASSVSFTAAIYDDDGPNGGPGTLLDSVVVPSSSIALNAYTQVSTQNTVTIPDGGFYVLWYMGGDGINLGYSTNPPISRQSYEVLGGSWAAYRDVENQDFLMRVNYEVSVPKDLSVSKIISPDPALVLNSDATVRIRIKNFSSVAVDDFNVSYQLDNQPVVTELYKAAAIQPGDSGSYMFSAKIPAGPGGDLCAWTSIANDTNSTNDQTCQRVYGMNVEEMELFTVYPNPSNGEINFSKGGEYRLYSFDGRLIWSGEVQRGESENFDFLSPGVYLFMNETGQAFKWTLKN